MDNGTLEDCIRDGSYTVDSVWMDNAGNIRADLVLSFVEVEIHVIPDDLIEEIQRG